MKILILGSEGFVGNVLVEGLEKSHEILTADLIEKSTHKNYNKFNITNFESVEKTVKNVDVVIDLRRSHYELSALCVYGSAPLAGGQRP